MSEKKNKKTAVLVDAFSLFSPQPIWLPVEAPGHPVPGSNKSIAQLPGTSLNLGWASDFLFHLPRKMYRIYREYCNSEPFSRCRGMSGKWLKLGFVRPCGPHQHRLRTSLELLTWPALNPWWKSVRIRCSSRCFRMLLVMICSVVCNIQKSGKLADKCLVGISLLSCWILKLHLPSSSSLILVRYWGSPGR